MRDAAAVCVMRQDADADHERSVRLLAHEERAEVVEERAGSKQRLEAGWGSGVDHGAKPIAAQSDAKNECLELNYMHLGHASRRTTSMKPSVAAERSSPRQARLSGTLIAGLPLSVR